jgi:peptidoglycan/LPS O-acetylase OafA/YrhL
MEVRRTGERIAALDGVRAIAIAPVVASHAFGWPQGGGFGVDVFFVLSGYLITTLLIVEREATGRLDMRHFYIRRARRLLPALAVMLAVVSAVSAAAGGGGSVLAASGITAIYGANIASSIDHLTFPAPLGHMWSLSAEEQFYLVWPALLILLARRRHLFPLIVLGLAVLAAVRETQLAGDRLAFSPEGRSSAALLVGCAGALVAPRLRPLCQFLAPAVAGPVLFALLLPTAFGWTHLALMVAIAMLVIGVTTGGPLAWLLSRWPVAGLGRISYSLYLWHLPIIVAVRHGDEWLDWQQGLTAITLSVGAATVSYLLVERRWRRARSDAPVVATAPTATQVA